MTEPVQQARERPSFWTSVVEKAAVAVIGLIADTLLRKLGGIDVVGSVYCGIVRICGGDALDWGC